jgi:hypothetical protein
MSRLVHGLWYAMSALRQLAPNPCDDKSTRLHFPPFGASLWLLFKGPAVCKLLNDRTSTIEGRLSHITGAISC